LEGGDAQRHTFDVDVADDVRTTSGGNVVRPAVSVPPRSYEATLGKRIRSPETTE